jgi:hypothetical protein
MLVITVNSVITVNGDLLRHSPVRHGQSIWQGPEGGVVADWAGCHPDKIRTVESLLGVNGICQTGTLNVVHDRSLHRHIAVAR